MGPGPWAGTLTALFSGLGWFLVGFWLVSDCFFWLFFSGWFLWLVSLVGFPGWFLVGFWMVSGWFLVGFGWLLVGFWLVSGWFLVGFWLVSGAIGEITSSKIPVCCFSCSGDLKVPAPKGGNQKSVG